MAFLISSAALDDRPSKLTGGWFIEGIGDCIAPIRSSIKDGVLELLEGADRGRAGVLHSIREALPAIQNLVWTL